LKSSPNLSLDDQPPLFRKGSAKVLFALIVTVLHMLLTGLLFMLSFSLVMGSAAVDQPLSLVGEIVYRLSQLFQWPLVILLGRSEFLAEVLPAYSVIFILFLNSLLWALVILGIILGIMKLQFQQRCRTAI